MRGFVDLITFVSRRHPVRAGAPECGEECGNDSYIDGHEKNVRRVPNVRTTERENYEQNVEYGRDYEIGDSNPEEGADAGKV